MTIEGEIVNETTESTDEQKINWKPLAKTLVKRAAITAALVGGTILVIKLVNKNSNVVEAITPEA